ncbi:MAG: ferrous iron transporter B, partial [Clostridia bacterium]|nr:ferrous iron transporter B [Clostridia bacterium]
ILALILKGTFFKGKPIPFVMELPDYRLPSPKSVALLLWEKAKDFLKKAFTVIFLATVIIWFLSSFDVRINPVANSGDSMLASIGRFIAPAFIPCGFGDWRAVTSLISGFTAKEAVIGTLGVLVGDTTPELLGRVFSPLSAFSFLVFTLLYTPCIAAVTTIRRELHSRSLTLLTVLLQCVVGWICATLVFQIGSLFFR